MMRLSVVIFLMVVFSACAGRGNGTGCIVSQFLDTTAGKDLGVADKALGGAALAQSVTIDVGSSPVTLNSVTLRLYKKGTIDPNETVTLSIQADSSGAPSGTAISPVTEVSVSVSTIGEAAAYYTFPFASSVSISTSAKYWLVLRGSYVPASTNDTNLIKWQAHDGINGYADGEAKYETAGTTWTEILIGGSRDLVFQLGC